MFIFILINMIFAELVVKENSDVDTSPITDAVKRFVTDVMKISGVS